MPAVIAIFCAFGPAFPAGPARAAAASKPPKLYWLIPDGTRADPSVFKVFEFAREGRYPNIKKMMENGAYGYSIPTYPSHTPTNFATLLTGAYPERHGVADGPMHIEGHPLDKPSVMGFASTAKKIPPVWKHWEDNGLKVALVSLPGSTPPELDNGITVRGRWGKWGSDFFAVNFESTAEGNQRSDRGLGVRLFFMGPELTRFRETSAAEGWLKAPKSYSPPLQMTLEAYGLTVYAYIYDATDDGRTNYSAVLVSRDKKSPLAVLQSENEWTSWLPVALSWGGLGVDSSMKVCLIRLTPSGEVKLRLFFDTMNRTTVKPADLEEEFRKNTGPMVDFVDNWPAQLNRNIEDKAVFLSEAHMALDWHKRIAGEILEKHAPDAFIHDTYVPNQALESRWWLRYLDPASPDYNSIPEETRARLWEEMHSIYKKLDDILGEAIAKAGPDALIVFSSDHGVIPINKYLNPNNLLAKEGLLKFTIDEKSGEPVIDWAGSRAIHLKMHGIYLHPDGLAGDWHRGSGPRYEALRKNVAGILGDLRHGSTKPIRRILNWEQAGELRLPADRVADLILVLEPGYALSEEMSPALNVFGAPVQSGYKQALVADDTPGLWTPFVIMGPGVKKGYRIEKPIRHVDQVPTILTLMQLDIPKTVQGRVLDEILAD